MPDTMLSPDGISVNAVRGYVDMTARLIQAYKPDRLVACLDGDWRPSWRVDIFPEYKANRIEEDGESEEEPETLTPQIPILLDLLDLFGIPVVGVDDYEADDVMATYAHLEKGPIRIVTGDRDMFQVVDDKKDVKVVYLAKGLSQHDLVDIKYVANKYSIPGDRYDLFAMFRGDPSDGLPGVKGIGEKGAAIIASSFATVEQALTGARNGDENLAPALAKKIIAGAEYLKIAPTLVRVARDVPLPRVDLTLPKAPTDLSSIYQFKERYALGASVDRLISALGW
jgi:5'-3' exonuclease